MAYDCHTATLGQFLTLPRTCQQIDRKKHPALRLSLHLARAKTTTHPLHCYGATASAGAAGAITTSTTATSRHQCPAAPRLERACWCMHPREVTWWLSCCCCCSSSSCLLSTDTLLRWRQLLVLHDAHLIWHNNVPCRHCIVRTPPHPRVCAAFCYCLQGCLPSGPSSCPCLSSLTSHCHWHIALSSLLAATATRQSLHTSSQVQLLLHVHPPA